MAHILETIGILPFSDYTQKKSGSSSLRAYALADTTEDFKIWRHGVKYNSLIFQKVYWNEMMEVFKGPKILDLCDPDWIDGTVEIRELGSLVDVITCSSEGLTRLVKSYFLRTPVVHVPDRLNFNLFPKTKPLHQGRARRVVWFGFVKNAENTLPQLASCIKKHNLELLIISNLPYTREDEVLALNPLWVPFKEESAYRDIQEADIALNPKSSKAYFKYKSDNKSVISWKLGLAVAETSDELELLLEPSERNIQVANNLERVNKEYNIARSAEQYRQIIADINKTNNKLAI